MKLSYILKYSKFAYSLYFYAVSALLRFFGVFIKTDAKLILFSSFGGKKYDDSPKSIYEAMLGDSRFSSYRLVWSFQNPSEIAMPQGMRFVKTDTIAYFKTALSARVWVTNSSIERGLSFKKKRTFCLNTWHGTPIKLMGTDIEKGNKSFRGKAGVRADIMLAQGKYDVEIFSHAFELPVSCFRTIGLPRNDVLFQYTETKIAELRKRLGIPDGKIVLLYAPTFREFSQGKNHEVVLDLPIDTKKWQRELGEKYTVLFRAHYEVARHVKLDDVPLFVDVSRYPSLDELMIVSDALISDYSSIYFDYSIMHKPMYCFAYDYEDYANLRGMYIDLKNELPCTVHKTEAELLSDLKDFKANRAENCKRVEAFQQKYVTTFGYAANKCCDIIAETVK